MRRFFTVAAVVAATLFTGGAAVAHPVGDHAARPQAGTCRSVDLGVAFGRVEGAAGTVYREVLLTNRGIAPCALRGHPGVSYVDPGGEQVGAAAVRSGDRGSLLTLPHGATAVSDVGFARVDNFDPDLCRKTPVWGIKVFPPDETTPLYLPMSDQHGCAGDVSPFGDQLTVTGLRG
ncbi:DUF4232 domain-containing protein [Saccharothrix algeriensis]|uniref:DUF4232 domain-containing protein n=1 Tax=Saccharothrix algeriensis TaxID=173560 RepID=A0A8T8I3T6_9PSEU|nr:DUF4232 domain-containing protein [Saccharothrix algeriensis]MBM7811674.1 hypothetical protein [Saccharothrix algeriensis]QTR05452.1 DUF4232 domain-containing protein [Saccharothrix algeriensis]